jgi:hypothetical protein
MKSIVFWINSDTQIKNMLPVYVLLKRMHHLHVSAVSTEIAAPMNGVALLKENHIPFEYARCTELPSIFPMKARTLSKLWSLARWNRKFVRQKAPDLVVFGNDYIKINKVAIAVLRRAGCKTLLLQDGIIINPDPGYAEASSSSSHAVACGDGAARRALLLNSAVGMISNAIRTILGLGDLNHGTNLMYYGAGGCDAYAVGGEAAKRLIAGRETPSDRIFITGIPRYDCLAASASVPCDSKAVLWTNDIMEFEPVEKITSFKTLDDYVEAVFAEMGNLAHYRFLVKPHPRNKLETFRRALEKSSASNIRLMPDVAADDLLRQASALISYHSSTIIEALALKKPVAVINFNRFTSPYLREGGRDVFYAIDSIKELGVVLDCMLQDPGSEKRKLKAMEKMAVPHIGAVDGRSSERTALLIKKLVQNI